VDPTRKFVDNTPAGISSLKTIPVDAKMSSRFFKAADSSDSEESEHDLYSDDEEEEGQEKEGDDSEEDSDDDNDDDESSSSDSDAGVTGAARFLKPTGGADSGSDSDSEDEKDVILKSARDKRFDEAEAVVKSLEHFVRIDDWANVNSEFDKLGRLIPNLVKILDGRNPKLYSMTIPLLYRLT
jgi:translation initiation factor 3 subunit C